MPFAEIFGNLAGGFQGLETGRQNRELWNELQSRPGFDESGYGEASYVGDFNPELYATPEAAQYQTVSEDPRTREYQMQALARLQSLADQSAGSAEALGRYNAVSDANAVAAQQNAGIRNQMAMRGQGGSGLEFVLQQQAAQNAANRAQSAGLNAAQQAALQRLMGTQGVMQGASNVRGMDADVASRNADIINRFNMHNSGMRNQANMANVDMRNQAGMRNLGTKQDLSIANTGIRNQNVDRGDRNKINTMSAERDWTRGMIGENSKVPEYLEKVGRGFGEAADTAMRFGGYGG